MHIYEHRYSCLDQRKLV